MNGNNPDYPLHSISEITKRTYQLALTAIVIGFLLFLFYCVLGLYHIALMVATVCCVIGFIFFLNSKKIITNTKLPLIAFVSLSLIVFAANEGAATGQYLYYFPLIISIPVIVDNQKTYFKKIIFYFGISAVCCLVCIIVGNIHHPWEPLSAINTKRLFYTNAVSAIVSTIGFAYINISLERKYLKELIDQKNHTIASRTQFLSTMGHELRTPLNGIIGAINLLKKSGSLPEQQEYFDILKYCSDHMLHQVNDILDFNKIEAGKLEIHPLEVNLKQLLVNSTIPFAGLFEEKNLELKVDIDPKLNKTVLADDVRLIQIMNNLLSNAGKFTSSGYIKLRAALLSENKNFLQVMFSVEDTGSGIALEDQARVFDSFGQVFEESTRKYTGSGLGLAICTQILELMNSKMKLQSAKGVGSTFSFEIKFELPAETSALEVSLNKDKSDLAGTKILLVEDNQINMVIAKKILANFNADCTKAYNGEEALAALAEDSAFHIILMDLEMPVMDGYTAIKQIKKNWPHLPVLAFTATLMDVDMMDKLKAIGFEDCILKPFQGLSLLEQIKKHALAPAVNLKLQ
jgi:signal transduction histidine kinase/BarA-like signal transduction histidine kinase